MTIADKAVNPLGIPVDLSPAKRPQQTALKGRMIALVLLNPKVHAEALYENICDQGAENL